MDPGSSAPGRPHPRSPAARFACTHPLPPQTDTATARPGPDRAQEEPGTAGLCTRLELWALEVEGLFPAAQPALHRELLLPWDGAALQAVPVGVCLSSSRSSWGSALPGQLPGTEPAQSQGARCPLSALSPVAPQRAQSIEHPAPSTRLSLSPAPDLAPAGHTGLGVEGFMFIPDWEGHVGAWRELRSGAGSGVPLAQMGLGWCRRLPGCCRTQLILLAFFFF